MKGIFLKCAIFFSGAVLMSTEVLGFRIIGKSFGTALRETSSVIAVFLGSMSLGYFFGGKWIDRRPELFSPILAQTLAGLLIFLIPFIDDPLNRYIFYSRLPIATHAIVTSFLLFFAPSLFLASIFPMGVRLLSKEIVETGKVAGKVSAISTAGSILGTIFAGFYLIETFQITTSLYILSLIMIFMAFVTNMEKKTARLLILLPFFILPCSITIAWGATTLFERDSPYHHIIVRDEGIYRTLYFDDSTQSRMEIADPLKGAYEYTDFFHVPFIFNPEIRNVLFIGLGGASGPKRFINDYPNAQIDVADIDPVVIEVAKRFFYLPSNPRLTIYNQDGRTFIKRAPRTYDLIVIDAYTKGRYGSTIPFHLTTKEFFEEAKRVLSPQGILVYNVTGELEGKDGQITRAICKTIESVFPGEYIFDAESSMNTVLVALKNRKDVTKKEVKERGLSLVKKGVIKLPHFLDRLERLYSHQISTDDVPFLTDEYAPVETLIQGRW